MSIKQQKANSKMMAPTIRPLESCKRAQFKDDYNIIILEQWKTCVEMANCNSEKRNTMNTLYITINSALIAVISFAWENKSIFLSIVGIFVCLLWLGALKSYKQLSVVKYDIIQKIENKLPLAPFSHEWDKVGDTYKYVGQTKIERVLPWTFIVLYFLSLIWPMTEIALRCN